MLYTVRLGSQTDDQWRQVTVDAASEKAAKALALRQEFELVKFSIIPVQPVEPEEPKDSANAEVLVQYANALEDYASLSLTHEERSASAQEVLRKLEEDHAIDKTGKVRGPTKYGKAHLHAHHQKQPYKVLSVEPIYPNADQLVLSLMALRNDHDHWGKFLKRLEDEGIPLAAVTGSLFGVNAQKMIDGSGSIVYSSATMKVALTTSTYTPDMDTHDFFNDVTNEVTGTGYTAGGATLASKTSTYDTATDQIRLDAADTSWTTSTITARRAVLWNDTAGASSTDPVVGWVDFGADVSTTAGTFQITWDATGIVVYDVT